MERYTDEKHPEVVYRVVELEEQPSRPKRPLWRRFVRVILTIVAASMLWSTFAPVFHHGCSRHRNQDYPPALNFDPVTSEEDIPSRTPLKHYTFSPDLKNFWIKQDSLHGVTRTQVVGNLIVASCDKAENISAHFKLDATDDDLLTKIVIEPKEDGLVFKLDPFSVVKQTVNATIWVVLPKGDDYKLDHLRVGTTQLNVWLKDSFTTKVNATYVSSVSGDIHALGKWSSGKGLDINNIKVSTTSGHIKGEYPLQHATDLESTSGHIHATIASQDKDEKKAYLKTNTVSGNTKLAFAGILNPRPLYSYHHSVSGDLDIGYPEDWQGGLKVETTSGHISIEGKGTKVVKKEKDVVGKFWKVIKGDGKSKGSLVTVSGKIDVLIGDREDDE